MMVVPVAWNTASKDAEVRAAVLDQETEVPEPLAEVEGQVAGLLHRPLARQGGGDAAEVHPAGAVLDEDQDVQPGQRHCVNMQEVRGEDPGGLRAQEPPRGPAVPARRRVNARGAQDFIDNGTRSRRGGGGGRRGPRRLTAARRSARARQLELV